METIRLYDVTPRDGLQNEPDIVDTEDKVELILNLVRAGYKDIEVTSFVAIVIHFVVLFVFLSWQTVQQYSNLSLRRLKACDFGHSYPIEEA